jgi:hypothetical protein
MPLDNQEESVVSEKFDKFSIVRCCNLSPHTARDTETRLLDHAGLKLVVACS